MPFCLKIVEHLASQVGKRQTRIMRVPEIMCPKKGTNMIGFLPESEENSYQDISIIDYRLSIIIFHLYRFRLARERAEVEGDKNGWNIFYVS